MSAVINGTPVSATATVTVTAGAVSGSQSSVNADPAGIAAGGILEHHGDGGRWRRQPGCGCLGRALGDWSGNNLTQPGVTNASGVATGTFSSTSLGAHTITATANGTAISDNATVTVTRGRGEREPVDRLVHARSDSGRRRARRR